MILNEVALHNVRGFKRLLRLKFSSGLNLIQGDNGSGKTTIVDSLFAVLSPTSGNEEMREGQAGIIINAIDGQVYRLVRDFSKKKSSLACRNETGKFISSRKNENQIHQFIQQNTHGLDNSVLSLAYALRKPSMPSYRFHIFHPDLAISRQLPFPATLDSFPAAITASDREKILARVEELTIIQKNTDEIRRMEDQLADFRNYSADLGRRIRISNEKSNAIKEIEAKSSELDAILPLPPDQYHVVAQYQEQQEVFSVEKETLNGDKSELQELIKSVPTRPIYLNPLFVSGSIILPVSFLLSEFARIPEPLKSLTIFPLMIGIGFLLYAVIQDFRLLSKRKSLESQLRILETQSTRVELDFNKDTAAAREILIKTKSSTPLEFQRISNEYEQRLAVKRDLMDAKDTALQGRTANDLELELKKTSEDIKNLEHRIRLIDDSVTDLYLLENELNRLREQLSPPDLSNREQANPPSGSKETPLYDLLPEPIRLILLNDPFKSQIQSNLKIINESIHTWLEKFPQGRTVKVTFKEDITLTLTTKNGLSISPYEQNLSLLDLVYLMVFLSIATVLSEPDPFPIILDDPLMCLDRKNQQICLDILREIGQNKQVLFLSTFFHPYREGHVALSLPSPEF